MQYEEYLIYLRKSRSDASLEAMGVDVLERHEQILLDLAKRMNLSIGGIYREVVSGESISARPEMQKLLSEVESGRWEGVLVMEVERLARGDTVDQGIVQRAFQYSGTKIITPTKTYNPNNEFDEEYFEFGLFMSRREYKTIRRRMRAGVTAAVKEGKWPFNQAPYGWQRVKLEHGRGWVLAPDPDEAPVVKLIFRLYTGPDRIGITHICRYLDNRGIKPRNGDTWLECSVMGILRNIVNDQRVGIGRRKVIKQVQNGSVSKVRPHSDYDFTAPGLQPRLIDHDVFLEAQEYLARNSHKLPESYGIKNPLAGILVCSCCGKKMQRRPASRDGSSGRCPYDVLMCNTRGCPTIGSTLELVERELIQALSDWVAGYQLDPTLEVENKVPEKEQLLSSAVSNHDLLLKQNGNLYDLLEQGVYTTEIFLERSHELQKRIKESEEHIEILKKDLEYEKEKIANIENFIPSCKELLSCYWDLSVQDRNKALKMLLESVEYTKTKRNRKGDKDNPTFTLNLKPRIPRI